MSPELRTSEVLMSGFMFSLLLLFFKSSIGESHWD